MKPGSAALHVLQLLPSSGSVGTPDPTTCYLSVGLVDFISVALMLLAGLDCLFMSKKNNTWDLFQKASYVKTLEFV